LLSGLDERECPRCHRAVDLPLGALCGHCRAQIERRARKAARIVSLVSTAVVAAYVALRMPDDQTARLVGAAGVIVWFFVSYAVVRRTMRNYQK
jgi:small basic protein